MYTKSVNMLLTFLYAYLLGNFTYEYFYFYTNNENK